MNEHVLSFLDFIKSAPSAFHAVSAVCRMLEENGFGKLVAHGAYTMNLCTADPEARAFAADVAAGKYGSEELTEDLFDTYLYSKNVPDPELIIRPSGEQRTSNFLLWQSAYSEYVFMNVLWPDFSPEHLDEAIAEYHRRNRRFGGV